MTTTRNSAVRINRSGPAGHSHALDVAWTDYIPVVAQGITSNISKTINTAKYAVVGNMATVQVNLTMTGAGTNTQPVFVTTPVPPALTGHVVGNGGIWYQANVAMIATIVMLYSDGRFVFRNAMVASNAYVGVSPASALAVSDGILLTATYPIA